MSLIWICFIVIVLLAIAIYGIQALEVIQRPFKGLLIALACFAAIIVIASKAGLF